MYCVFHHTSGYFPKQKDEETQPIGIPRVLSVRRDSLWTTKENANLVRTKVPPRA